MTRRASQRFQYRHDTDRWMYLYLELLRERGAVASRTRPRGRRHDPADARKTVRSLLAVPPRLRAR